MLRGVAFLAICYMVFQALPLESFDALKIPVQTLKLQHFVLAFSIYMFQQFVRTLRFRLLLGNGGGSFFKLYLVTNIYYLLNSTLPMRTGELSMFYLAKKHLAARHTSVASTLIINKVSDFMSLMAAFCLAMIWHFSLGRQGNWRLIAASSAIVLIFVLAFRYIDRLMSGALHLTLVICRALGLEGNSFVELAERNRRVWIKELGSTRDPHIAVPVVGVAVLLVITGAVLNLLLFRGFDFNAFAESLGSSARPTLPAMIIGTVGSRIACLLPINFVGDIGTYEAGWLLGYTGLLGWSPDVSAFMALWSHAIRYIYIVILGALSWGLLVVRRS